MASVFDNEQLWYKLPDEIWKEIIEKCLENGIHFFVSRRLITKVLAVVSKHLHKIIKQAHLELAVPDTDQFIFYPRTLADYCCQQGYASLLKYAIDRGSTLGSGASSVASQGGHLDCLKVLADHGCQFNRNILDQAARHGRLEVVEYLIENGIEPTMVSMKNAVLSGKVELVKFLNEKIKIDNYSTFGYSAAGSGSLAMVKFIEQYAPLEQQSVVATAHSGSVEVLQYFIDKGFTLNDPSICTIASNLGRREYLKLALSHGAPMDVNVMKHCARYNDVDLIRELHSRGCPWNSSAVKSAASHGSFEALIYLVENGCPIADAPQPQIGITVSFGFSSDSDEATLLAARNCHLSCLKYLMERGAPWPQDIISKTLRDPSVFGPTNVLLRGQLAVVKYLHEQGCTWDATATESAAELGNIELLKYLHENDCPWDARSCAGAATRGKIDCLKYALDNGCEWDHRTMDNAAILSGSLETLKFVFERGIPWSADTFRALVSQGKLEMLQYAHENGAPWALDTITLALNSGLVSLDCIKYAIENGCPWDLQEAVATAQSFGHRNIVEWLQNNVMRD